MNSKHKGDISEAYATMKFLKLGWVVLKPFGDNQRYDLVIDRGSGFERIQVKTGRIKEGRIIFEACSSSYHRDKEKDRSYHGEIELLAVYSPELEKLYLIPVDEFNKFGSLRIESTKNNQKTKVKWASDFEI